MSVNTITRYKGDTYSIEATLGRTDKVTGITTPVDFTDGSTAVFTFTKGTVIVTIPGVNGDINGNISFPFTGQEAILAGTYAYDMQVTSLAGEIRTFVKDTLIISTDVTP